MSWWSLEARPGEREHEAVAAWLVAATGNPVEERSDGTVVAAIEGEEVGQACLRDLRAQFGDTPAELRALVDVDWGTAWREGLAARTFGRLVVAPSWVDHVSAPGQVEVRMDPEMAFGSGEHGSTRVALALLERHLRPGDRVLDLGTGSGILAIAASRLGARQGVGIEIDAEAVEVAERNAARNAATNVAFVTGDAASLAPLLGPVDVVVANILRLINEAVLPEVVAALAPGGLAIFSGMEETEAPLFRPPLTEAGLAVVDEVLDEGWWGVAARRA